MMDEGHQRRLSHRVEVVALLASFFGTVWSARDRTLPVPFASSPESIELHFASDIAIRRVDNRHGSRHGKLSRRSLHRFNGPLFRKLSRSIPASAFTMPNNR